MSALSVFRTTDPARLAAWEQWKVDVNAWDRRLRKCIKELQPGPVKRKAMMRKGWGSETFAGYEASYGETPPSGWRIDKSGGYRTLVPRLSTKEGKAAAAKMRAVGSRPSPDLGSMPSTDFTGLSFLSAGVQEHDGVLYVLWATDAPPQAGDEWEPVKLSEWYALVEARAEAAS